MTEPVSSSDVAGWHDGRFGAEPDVWVLAKLVEELGEVAGAMVKAREGRATHEDLLDELGDAAIALTALCHRAGVPLEDVRARRFAEVSQRPPAQGSEGREVGGPAEDLVGADDAASAGGDLGAGHEGIWRSPDEETLDAYPGLCVHDGRVAGSITFGPTRLPVWSVLYTALIDGWDEVERGWEPSTYGWDDRRLAEFLHHLLNVRGEFARLLCVLADVERLDAADDDADHVAVFDGEPRPVPARWWNTPSRAERVARALRDCLDTLPGGANPPQR